MVQARVTLKWMSHRCFFPTKKRRATHRCVQGQQKKYKNPSNNNVQFSGCQTKQKQLYHLESRWLATPISLGSSWPLTNRHQTWEWLAIDPFTTV